MSTNGFWVMIKGFEGTGKLEVQPGRGRKRVTPVLVEGVKRDVDAQFMTSEFWGSSACAVSRQTGYFYSTVQKVLRKHNALLSIHDPLNPGAVMTL
ncbi:hypothetical protein TNCV_5007611 [Trichonephila clavipes]|nr:hypothetical protein TNCV_5007611 [Trichonephila clavipes]